MNRIGFNKPYLAGREFEYMRQAIASTHISGDGSFTARGHGFFEQRYGFRKCLLTSSCTDALEMCALLARLEPGDEVIAPAYAFVSTANAFALRGAKIVFADSEATNPNIDAGALEPLISEKTRAIVLIHYAGVACDMDRILQLAESRGILVIEDAAHAIDSHYRGRPLGGLGHLAAFSFHETKNVISGEGGMLIVNDKRFLERADIIRQKGTNRSAFFRGEVDKYSWVDLGSSFLPSDLIAAFLLAQLEKLDEIQRRRLDIWDRYWNGLRELEAEGFLKLPFIPDYAENNAHMFYILCRSLQERTSLIRLLAENNIGAVFHYLSLHSSPYYAVKHDGRSLPRSDYYMDHLLRLPFYCELNHGEQDRVIGCIREFYAQAS
jgi:dTDP-4-amino-4,6-dideoxygalactose transaminase